MLTPSQTNTHSSHLSPLTICSYITSKLHFKQNVSTKSSEIHFKLRGGRRKAEKSSERESRERDRERRLYWLRVSRSFLQIVGVTGGGVRERVSGSGYGDR